MRKGADQRVGPGTRPWPDSGLLQKPLLHSGVDPDGKLLRSWGGPGRFPVSSAEMQVEAGCIWRQRARHFMSTRTTTSGFREFGGGGRGQNALDDQRGGRRRLPAEVRHERQLQAEGGRHSRGPNSNDTNGGINGTPLLYLAADMVVDPKTNRLFVSDGYGNRRV